MFLQSLGEPALRHRLIMLQETQLKDPLFKLNQIAKVLPLRNSKDSCAVCMRKMGPKCGQLPCKHSFHIDCIQIQGTYFSCPTCSVGYGTKKANQIVGTFHKEVIKEKCQGYDSDTILIKFNLDGGTQNGRKYKAIEHLTYIPNTCDGQEVALLLEKVFNAGLLFSIQKSMQTGEDLVTFKDITFTNLRKDVRNLDLKEVKRQLEDILK